MQISSFKDVRDYAEKNRLMIDVKDSYYLKRIKKLLEKLDNPQDQFKAVHVAGTSGKTSTCYYMSELLRLNGYKVGLSISPHLEEINERVQVNSTPISEQEFCRNFDEFIKVITPHSIQLTYFEMFIAFAYWYFAKIKVDYAVVEVGVGGLLDATNTISREDKICIITDIGLDHMSVLGDTVEEIARQKVGIIQPGNKVFCNRQDEQVMAILEDTVKSKGTELFINPKDDFASFKARNFSLSKLVADKIFKKDGKSELSSEQLKEASNTVVPGRLEEYSLNGKTVILDGAHNYQKLENLLKSLRDEDLKDCCFVIALGENKKDHLLRISQTVSKIAKHVILTSFKVKQDFKRVSLSPNYLKEYFENVPKEQVFDMNEAIEKALNRPEKTVIFTGSLYMVGPVRAKLKTMKN